MNTITKITCRLSVLAILIVSAVNSYGQTDRLDKTYTWNYETGLNAIVEFNNYDCNLEIHTWDKPGVEYRMSIIVETKNNEDIKTLDKYLRNMEFDNTANRVNIENRFWTSRTNIAGRKTIKLSDGPKLSYKTFEMHGELYIPADAAFRLKSKYSRINMENINGNFVMDLYNDKLLGGECNGKVDIKAKYSTIEFTKTGIIKADLYDCDLSTGNTLNAEYVSKYSKIISEKAGDLKIESYDDKFMFDSAGDIEINAKYSDLKAGSCSEFSGVSYDCSYEVSNCENIRISSKYSKYIMGKATGCSIKTSYTDSFSFREIDYLSAGESKYSKYNIERLGSGIKIVSGYTDNINVKNINPQFKNIYVNGKYVKTELSLTDDISFRIKANIKYPKLEFDEEKLTLKLKIVESSNLEYEAYRGKESDNMPLIRIEGYDMTLKLIN